jgi:hypothetical protein
VIDGHLTEVNVTSPTGFRELAAVGGVRLDRVFADWLSGACARPANDVGGWDFTTETRENHALA